MSTLIADKSIQVMSGFMASQCVFSAVNMDIFVRLGEKALDIGALARTTGMSAHATDFLMNNLVNEGFVTIGKDGRYRNARQAALQLSGKYPEHDMRDAYRFYQLMSYPKWQHLTRALRGDPVKGNLDFTPEEWEIFTKGVGAITRPTARALPRKYDFNKHHRVLDVGGGWGNFLVEMLGVYPRLEATLFELPNVAQVARTRFEGHELAPRIEVVEGNFFIDALPTDHDVAVVANVVHHYPPEKNREMLMAIRKSVSSGAVLLIVDYFSGVKGINETIVYRWFGEFLQFSGGEGRGYSQNEVSTLLSETDWRVSRTTRLTSVTSCIVAEAIGG